LPGIVRLDVIPWKDARGPQEEVARGAVRDLAAAAEAQLLGAVVHRLRPGDESYRYHEHEQMEEVFLVLAGAPTILLDGREILLREGDAVHCPPWAAHTFRNGSTEDAEVLMAARLPERSDVVYPGWKMEAMAARAGSSEEARDRRVRNLAELPWEDDAYGRDWGGRRSLTEGFDLKQIAVAVRTLRPGALSPPYHSHTAAEEIYIVLEGRPVLLRDGAELPLATFSVLHFPPGEPHALANREQRPAKVVTLRDLARGDQVELPAAPRGWKGPRRP